MPHPAEQVIIPGLADKSVPETGPEQAIVPGRTDNIHPARQQVGIAQHRAIRSLKPIDIMGAGDVVPTRIRQQHAPRRISGSYDNR